MTTEHEERLAGVLRELLNISVQMKGESDDFYRERFRSWARDIITASAPPAKERCTKQLACGRFPHCECHKHARISREHEQAIADADYDEKHAAMKVLLRKFGWPNDAGNVMALYPDLKAIMEPEPVLDTKPIYAGGPTAAHAWRMCPCNSCVSYRKYLAQSGDAENKPHADGCECYECWQGMETRS